MGTIEGGSQRGQVGRRQALVGIGIAEEEVAFRRPPFVVGQSHPGRAITAQGVEVGLIRRQPVEAVATVAGVVPESHEIGCHGSRPHGQQERSENDMTHGADTPRQLAGGASIRQ
ncbi:hypothetical protein D3C76_993710 [compost metagenome]